MGAGECIYWTARPWESKFWRTKFTTLTIVSIWGTWGMVALSKGPLFETAFSWALHHRTDYYIKTFWFWSPLKYFFFWTQSLKLAKEPKVAVHFMFLFFPSKLVVYWVHTMSWAVCKKLAIVLRSSQSNEGDKTWIVVSCKSEWLSSIINLSK